MRESQFQSQWIKSWYYHFPGCHVFKIPDAIRPKKKDAETRFIPRKPYDIAGAFNGVPLAMELKIMGKAQAFPYSAVTEGQVENLLEAAENGAESMIVIGYFFGNPPSKKARELIDKYLPWAAERFVAVIPIQVFQMMDTMEGALSIPFERILVDDEIIKLKSEKVGDDIIWDIEELIMGLLDVEKASMEIKFKPEPL